ncbi:MAG: DsbA family protein [Burkholderiales bacterium]|nr:DsbA family protein [Burkholderiales bacterium]
MHDCDPVAGACASPGPHTLADPAPRIRGDNATVHYVGDPMCSWCWGISPAIHALAARCARQGIAFTLTMGGLRAGGGDPWNAAFKDFLRNEWRHIARATGQPFGFTLLDRAEFDYDTEPACRAVVTVQMLQQSAGLDPSLSLRFFSAVQQHFYVDGEDPKTARFHAGICAALGIDFDAFRLAFESAGAREGVRQSFQRARQWGVRSFPTLLYQHDSRIMPLAVGYVTPEQALDRLDELARHS